MIKMKIQNCGNAMVHAGAFAGRSAVPATSELLKLRVTLGTNAFCKIHCAMSELLKLCRKLGHCESLGFN